MTQRLLLVDDDPNLLQGLKRQYHNRFDFVTAQSGMEAIKYIEEHDDIAVVVSDMRMPDLTGLETLKKIRNLNQNIVRIMLTGNADQQTAVDAINEGEIFRFYSKPCDPNVLAQGIDEAFRYYELLTLEKTLLEKTLGGTVKFLVDLLSFSQPEAFARSARIREWGKLIIPHLNVKAPWRLDLAAMFLPLDDLIVPQEITEKAQRGGCLTEEEQESLKQAPVVIQGMLKQIPRLEEIADIVANAHKGFEKDKPEMFPIESRILHILNDLARQTPRLNPNKKAFKALVKNMEGYDEEIFHLIQTVLLKVKNTEIDNFEIVVISISLLRPGQTLLSNIKGNDGRLLLAQGCVLTRTHIEKLKTLARHVDISNEIKVARPLNG